MKGVCFFSIAYLILANPYLLGTAAHQCVSQIDIDNEYSFSIAKLPSPSESSSMEEIEDVENHDDNDYFSTLYQIAATKACYESCSSNTNNNNNNNKAQIMTYSNGFIQNKNSPLTILDRHHNQLSNLQFLQPNEIYLVKYSDINNEGGSSGLGCFELDDNEKIIHYSFEHPVCKKAKSVICGEKKNISSLESTSLNIEDEESNPVKYKHLNDNVKLNIEYLNKKKHHPKKKHPKEKSKKPTKATNTTTTITTPTINDNNNNNEIEPERKGNANLTNIEIQSGKDINNNDDNNVYKRRKRSLSLSIIRNNNKRNISNNNRKRSSHNKKKAVIDHYRKNTEQLINYNDNDKNNNTNINNDTLADFSLHPIDQKNNNITYINIDSSIQNTNDTLTDFNTSGHTNNNTDPSLSPSSTASLSSDTTTNNNNKLNKTNIYQVNKNNSISKSKEVISNEKEVGGFSIIRLPNAIESTTAATEACQQQFEENHLGPMKTISKHHLLHRRLYSSYGNMVISSWNDNDDYNDYNTKSHRECLMYNTKDNGIRFAPCSEATTVLCVKSLNEFLLS